MVDLAILIGIFSYFVFGLGILGKLERLEILGILFLLLLVVWAIKKKAWLWVRDNFVEIRKDNVSLLIIGFLFLQVLVNLIGALGPELGFDALWYHLTIPKIFLEQKRILFISGNLFYYSAMPKLTEMLYLVSLVFSNSGTLAKLIHFSFGVLSAAAMLNLSKKYLSQRYSLLTTLLFYTTLVVGWQSTTAYIDLARTFFEILALDCFLKWVEKKKETWNLIDSAVMMGLAISTKLIAFATLPVFLILIYLKSKKIHLLLIFFIFSIIVPLPWFIFSFVTTRNPFFPLFSGILDSSHLVVFPNLFRAVKDFWQLLYFPQDPISPVFLISLPILIWKGVGWAVNNRRRIKLGRLGVLGMLAGYVLLSFGFWYFTPKTGGSRFVLPYLPALCLLTVWVISEQKKYFRKIMIVICIFSAAVNIGYRALANKKYLPVLLRKQTKDQFLASELNFSFGDFYDTDQKLGKIIGKDDLVLVYGSHNLFYANFPFIHESCSRSGTYFSYVLTQDTELPKKLNKLNLIYQNPKTKVNLYLFGNKI